MKRFFKFALKNVRLFVQLVTIHLFSWYLIIISRPCKLFNEKSFVERLFFLKCRFYYDIFSKIGFEHGLMFSWDPTMSYINALYLITFTLCIITFLCAKKKNLRSRKSYRNYLLKWRNQGLLSNNMFIWNLTKSLHCSKLYRKF